MYEQKIRVLKGDISSLENFLNGFSFVSVKPKPEEKPDTMDMVDAVPEEEKKLPPNIIPFRKW
jgi:hypothetical protein